MDGFVEIVNSNLEKSIRDHGVHLASSLQGKNRKDIIVYKDGGWWLMVDG